MLNVALSRVLFAGLLVVSQAAALADDDRRKRGPLLATQLRRPVALAVSGGNLLVANRRSGTISVLDMADHTIVAEHAVARRIADMVPAGNGRVLLLDDARGQLLHVAVNEERAAVRPIADIPRSAARLALSADRRQVFVSARWERSIVAISLDNQLGAVEKTSIALPFAPHELLLLDDERKLIAADAFGGRLAIIDAANRKLLRVRRLDGHNIRGLAVSADGARLLVAHQQMEHRARADYEEVHWGRMVRNAVEVFGLADVLNGEAEQLPAGWLATHGGIGGATADPAGVVTSPEGWTAAAFSGTGEVAIRGAGHTRRLSVGARPEALLIAGARLYVANRFDDSLSLIDLHSGELETTISLGPRPPLTAAGRGEKLFYDARLSHDGWMSCHSCHTDGHTSGLLVDTLGDGDYGAPKLVPSLLGTHDTGPWSWTGSKTTLAEQVRTSARTTMHGEPLTNRQTSDLVAYLHSLSPPPARADGDSELVGRGRALFESQGCIDCHVPPKFTSAATFDVGLSDEQNRALFNPPSLRGVGQRSRFFHDGRASSLNDVLHKVRHQLDQPLSEEESAALRAFLHSL